MSVDAAPMSDELLRLAIDSLTEHAFLTTGPDGIVTSWSAGAELMFGYTAAEARRMHVDVLFSPEGPEAGAATLREADGGRPVVSRRWLLQKDGTPRYVQLSLVALRDGDRRLGYGAVAADVAPPAPAASDLQEHDALVARVGDTTRRLAESNALLESEIADRMHAEVARNRLLRRLVLAQEEERQRISRDLHDDLGQRLTALRLALEALRTDAGSANAAEQVAQALMMLERIDRNVDFLAWELRPAALEELGLAKVLDNYVLEWSRHTGVRAAFRAAAADAGRFPAEVEASVYRIAQEALNNVAKHARARSVNVLLERRGDDIVLVVEDDGIGYTPEAPTHTALGLAGMRERAAALGGSLDVEPTPETGTTVLVRVPIAGPLHARRTSAGMRHGDRRAALPAEPDPAPLPDDASGAVLRSLRARVQELQHAVTARDEFVATVAHELRNPVSPLMFQLRLAIEKVEQVPGGGDTVSAEWALSLLRRIEHRLHRLLETLDRLLDVSRLSTGRIDLQLEPVDLAVAVRDVISTFEAELAVARCPITFSERGDARGWWDRMRVEQICRNLLSNAIRFGAGRPIHIAVEADDEIVTLQVRDRGVGIARDHQARIFERFERGAEQRSGGFGIGLWVVKNICLAMGGTIEVDSEPGNGARFTVMLPRRPAGEFTHGREER